MKNLSSCCNAEVIESREGGLPLCSRCGKKCDLASPEVIEKWEERFLETDFDFYMSTNSKRKLMKFIAEELSTKEKEIESKIKQVWQSAKEDHICRFNDGEQRCECYYSALSDILELISKE